MPITPSFVLVNSAGVDAALANAWQSLAGEAIARWSAVLAGDATLTTRLEILTTTTSGRAQGGVGGVFSAGAPGGQTAWEGAPGAELRKGVNLNEARTDILIQVQASYLIDELWLDPTPATANDIPSNRTDGLSVLIHEIGHALGYIGYWNQAQNDFAGGLRSPYDWRLVQQGNAPFFAGPNAAAVFGGPVPLTNNNYSHYGNISEPPGANLLAGLMNGVTFFRGIRYDIGALDLAFLADLGLGTTRDDIFDQTWLDVIRGGAGRDVFRGDYSNGAAGLQLNLAGSSPIAMPGGLTLHDIERFELKLGSGADQVIGAALADRFEGGDGGDTLFGLGGDDVLDGGAGNDLVLGGDGDDLVSGGDGIDTVLGEAGEDRVEGNAGGDVVWGGAGRDTVFGGDGIDYLYGQEGDDILNGGADINVYIGGDGSDNMGSDLGSTGTTATQVLYGESGANLDSGGVVGNDSATGGSATDWFIMEAGDDTMIGGDGNDLIDMREGAGAPTSGDYAWGHGGADTFFTQEGQAGIEVIMDFQAGAGAGDVVRIAGLAYSSFAQVLAAAVESGGFTIIPLSGGAEAIYLWGVTKSQLAADDFVFG